MVTKPKVEDKPVQKANPVIIPLIYADSWSRLQNEAMKAEVGGAKAVGPGTTFGKSPAPKTPPPPTFMGQPFPPAAPTPTLKENVEDVLQTVALGAMDFVSSDKVADMLRSNAEYRVQNRDPSRPPYPEEVRAEEMLEPSWVQRLPAWAQVLLGFFGISGDKFATPTLPPVSIPGGPFAAEVAARPTLSLLYQQVTKDMKPVATSLESFQAGNAAGLVDSGILLQDAILSEARAMLPSLDQKMVNTLAREFIQQHGNDPKIFRQLFPKYVKQTISEYGESGVLFPNEARSAIPQPPIRIKDVPAATSAPSAPTPIGSTAATEFSSGAATTDAEATILIKSALKQAKRANLVNTGVVGAIVGGTVAPWVMQAIKHDVPLETIIEGLKQAGPDLTLTPPGIGSILKTDALPQVVNYYNNPPSPPNIPRVITNVLPYIYPPDEPEPVAPVEVEPSKTTPGVEASITPPEFGVPSTSGGSGSGPPVDVPEHCKIEIEDALKNGDLDGERISPQCRRYFDEAKTAALQITSQSHERRESTDVRGSDRRQRVKRPTRNWAPFAKRRL
jgi:hypothetical protein